MPNLKETLKELSKTYGDNSVDQIKNMKDISIERTPTGCLSLDWVLGGGLPRGRVVEVYGQPASGKTVMSLFCIKEIQKAGGKAAFFDAECAFSQEFAKSIGVDVNNLFLSQSVIAEDVLNMVDQLIKTNEMDLIVIDSIASLVPQAEFDNVIGKQTIALQARTMSQALRKIVGSASKSKTSLIFLNQVRNKVGVFYGNPETTPGGLALKFYSSIRLKVKNTKKILDANEEVCGNIMEVESVKNKVAVPFRKTSFEVIYTEGINASADLLDSGIKYNLISKKGSTYFYGEEKIGVGRDHSIKVLKENNELYNKIAEELKKIYYGGSLEIPRQVAEQEDE
jgi:recombination protein RecA